MSIMFRTAAGEFRASALSLKSASADLKRVKQPDKFDDSHALVSMGSGELLDLRTVPLS